ncbi:MAG: ABC transporter ATP-binding protein [Oscillospiraceae bacterium]|jgi:ABC-type multidrug transport system ATPase subunit|nr:ABC transporter ATP-binding protein [Oscillospiraceae bacterium]
MEAIQCNNVTKKFGDKTVLKGINFKIDAGSSVGLLGKNGAGKTTLNRILTGLSFATSGETFIKGDTPKCGNKTIGFLSENISVFPNLTACENLSQVFLINNIKPDINKIQSILDTVSIENSKKKAGKFSLGMKRRLQIAMSVLSVERDIIILDEPTNGLDINGVLWLKNLLCDFKDKGKTLIITSHAIRELENILSHYSIISDGKIVAFGKMSDICETDTVISLNPTDIIKVTELLNNNEISHSFSNNTVTVNDSNLELTQKCMALLLKANIVPLNFSTQSKSLVDLFVSYTEEKNA